jgi:hypothetical protein
MERSDENSSLRNWILARNFLKKLFRPLFLGVYCNQLQDAINCCNVVDTGKADMYMTRV